MIFFLLIIDLPFFYRNGTMIYKLNGFYVITLVDFYMQTCNMSRREAFQCIRNRLQYVPNAPEKLEKIKKIKKIIGKKVKIQGKADPAYVLCQAGCSEYTPYLPDKASAVKDYIAKTFARFTTGDQSLHAEIDACATLNPRLELNIEQVVSPVNEVNAGDMEQTLNAFSSHERYLLYCLCQNSTCLVCTIKHS